MPPVCQWHWDTGCPTQIPAYLIALRGAAPKSGLHGGREQLTSVQLIYLGAITQSWRKLCAAHTTAATESKSPVILVLTTPFATQFYGISSWRRFASMVPDDEFFFSLRPLIYLQFLLTTVSNAWIVHTVLFERLDKSQV